MSKYTVPTIIDMTKEICGSIKTKVLEIITVLYANVISEKNSGDGISVYGDLTCTEDLIVTGQFKSNGGGLLSFTTLTDDYTIANTDMGKIFGIATDAKTITLPAVSSSNKGGIIRIMNTGADGNNIVTISPNSDDAIYGSLPASAGGNADATTADSLVSKSGGVDDKDFVNTKTTANQGDFVDLMSDGSAGWWIVNGVGIWASEG